MVRRLTTNQEIAGSTPASVIFLFSFLPSFFVYWGLRLLLLKKNMPIAIHMYS